MRKALLTIVMAFVTITACAAGYTVTQATGKTIDCTGIIDTVPSTVKTIKVSMGAFRNDPTTYTNYVKQGYVVIITYFNGATYQIIKAP